MNKPEHFHRPPAEPWYEEDEWPSDEVLSECERDLLFATSLGNPSTPKPLPAPRKPQDRLPKKGSRSE